MFVHYNHVKDQQCRMVVFIELDSWASNIKVYVIFTPTQNSEFD